MPGSSIGKIFRVTTFGESHGRAIGVIVEGVPPNLELTEDDIQYDLDRRRPGQSKVSTPRKETDTVEIVSGVFDGRTMGPPVAMLIRNRNADPSAYADFKHKFRPGHADYTYLAKYGIRDWRGSGRASGRETACRVAAGAVAKKVLAQFGVKIVAFSAEIAGVKATKVDYDQIEENIVRTADADVADAMIAKIDAAREAENSVGGVVEVRVHGCPVGLGDPVFDKLEALLSHAIMSVGAIRGIEFGAGFEVRDMLGSQYNDEFYTDGDRTRTRTNNAGGILGGISSGEDIVIRAAIRPPASIAQEQKTVTVDGNEESIEVHGRHDPCIVPRVVPVVEAMVAMVLADCLLVQQIYQQHHPSHEDTANFLKKDWPNQEG